MELTVLTEGSIKRSQISISIDNDLKKIGINTSDINNIKLQDNRFSTKITKFIPGSRSGFNS